MRYVTSIERSGIEKGLIQGLEQELDSSRRYIFDVLTLRFQQTPEDVKKTLQKINAIIVA